MSDAGNNRELMSLFQFTKSELWTVFTDLADKSEALLRKILRPHAELEFGNDDESRDEIALRRRLDAALVVLTRLEVGYQSGAFSLDAVPLTAIPQMKSLLKLFTSEAFLRFTDAYLYFAIRFLACRITSSQYTCAERPDIVRTRDSNERPFSLRTPPVIDPKYNIVDRAFKEIVSLSSDVDPALNPSDSTDPQVRALRFLDGYTRETPEEMGDPTSEPERFELWLRGLCPEIAHEEEIRFSSIRSGLTLWAIRLQQFYLSLHQVKPESSVPYMGEQEAKRPMGGWIVTNPLASRFALIDVYWISRLLRADVLADGSITYARTNWLSLLRFRAGLEGGTEVDIRLKELRKAEEVLRSVFDFVCDLIQNATEVTEEEDRQIYEPETFSLSRPPETVGWRKVFDEELNEIEKERDRREYKTEGERSLAPDRTQGVPPCDPDSDHWMERLRKDKPVCNLIGLCFSGGGIRSATFNLGVLQGLQELDLLRQVDFLSTVSGGGYIGSWLVANVCRTKHWLGRLTSWDQSIGHLRQYSNYLAPRLGALSADTWTMWASWARNAFLIQLTGLMWLWFALLFALVGQTAFVGFNPVWADITSVLMSVVVLFTLAYNLSSDRAVSGNPGATRTGAPATGRPWSGNVVWATAILPAWLASFAFASRLWSAAETQKTVLQIVTGGINATFQTMRLPTVGWKSLFVFWLLLVWSALSSIAFFTLSRLKDPNMSQPVARIRMSWRIWHAAWISLFCAGILLLELRGILWLFKRWAVDDRGAWYAYIFGPPLVLMAHTIAVVLFIGFCGRHSKEALREWWTRLGAWLAIVGLGYLALMVAAVLGPCWTLWILRPGFIKWSSILAWIGTVAAGLLAGKSSKTSGVGLLSNSRWLEILAKAGGLVFIVGSILLASTGLYIALALTGTPDRNWQEYWKTLCDISHSDVLMIAALAALFCGALFSRFFEINIFGLNQFYRFRLVRCYLGATRWAPGFRRPQPFTNFDGNDDMQLHAVLGRGDTFRGPFPIFNCALNLSGSSDLALHTRHSASFSLTPLFCGADRRIVGYSPTERYAGGVMLGQAVAISGAAASPNMGFNTSPLVAFLLTMFNVRLGWWFPNPGRTAWSQPGLSFSLYYLLRELFGAADERNFFVNVSDGGHFENLGIYELVRRRCKVIIVSDAECDELLQFGSLANLVRMCETDFGAKIDINVSSIRQKKDGLSLAHCSVGRITYSNGSIGHLVYLKASTTGDEDVGIAQYRSAHSSFPHETTADQFFSEDQFESYRKLGQHIVRESFRGCEPGEHPVMIAEQLADVLAPAGCGSEVFLTHAKTLDRIWERFRRTSKLQSFFEELMRETIIDAKADNGGELSRPKVQDAETLIGLELIQLMENVFLDLRLDDFW